MESNDDFEIFTGEVETYDGDVPHELSSFLGSSDRDFFVRNNGDQVISVIPLCFYQVGLLC